jgi:hypothetical protein
VSTAYPAVLFLPGAAAIGLDYLNSHNRISDVTTSVRYDRAGTAGATPVDLPRARELREPLEVASALPPLG